MGLIEDLGPGPIALDTAPFIYLLEENRRYLPLIEPVFQAIDRGEVDAVTSALTLLEVLVVPLREGSASLARRYEALLTSSRGLTLVEIDTSVSAGAAHLRAALGLKTPDALHLATAHQRGCSSFVTNDRRLPDLPEVRVLQLNDYLER